MDLSPKEPDVNPRECFAIAFLADPSRSTVADPATMKMSLSVPRALWSFSSISAWSCLYSFDLWVIMGLSIALSVSSATFTGPTVNNFLLIWIPECP